jgi:glycosyltransferase XagB
MEFFLIIFVVLLVVQSFFSIITMTYGWHSKEIIDEFKAPNKILPPLKTFSFLLPARNEEAVIKDTILSLHRIEYPKNKYEIIIILVPEDQKTYDIASETIKNYNITNAKILIVGSLPKCKPHSLNVALSSASGEIICIIDAEDEISTKLLNYANTTFINKECEVLQCGVQLMNYNSQWFSTLSILEYFYWFKSSLLYFSKEKIMPLGGNSIFIKKTILNDVGGWDEECLTEDADLGVRLALKDVNISVLYDSQSCTKEETPENLKDYIKQRTRWTQGFFQILVKGDWKNLNTIRKKIHALYFLLWPIFQILITVYFLLSTFVFLFIKLNLYLSLFLAIPLFLILIQLGLLIIGLWIFTKNYNLKFYWYLPLKIILTYFPYQMILTLATTRAIWRNLMGLKNWEKTFHANKHRIN